MIAKGTPLVHFYEVFFEDKTKKPLALVYKIVGYGEFIRRDGMWLPFDDVDPDVFDGAEYVVLERSDAKKLNLVEKFDNSEHVSRDEVFKHGTDKYDDCEIIEKNGDLAVTDEDRERAKKLYPRQTEWSDEDLEMMKALGHL